MNWAVVLLEIVFMGLGIATLVWRRPLADWRVRLWQREPRKWETADLVIKGLVFAVGGGVGLILEVVTSLRH